MNVEGPVYGGFVVVVVTEKVTSLEDLGAATFKLINIVDHKVLTTSEVLQKSFESLLEVLQTSFRSPSLKFKALVQL